MQIEPFFPELHQDYARNKRLRFALFILRGLLARVSRPFEAFYSSPPPALLRATRLARRIDCLGRAFFTDQLMCMVQAGEMAPNHPAQISVRYLAQASDALLVRFGGKSVLCRLEPKLTMYMRVIKLGVRRFVAR